MKKQGELHCEGGQRKEMMEELEAELQRHTERAEAIRLKNEETVRAMEQMAKTARDVARRVRPVRPCALRFETAFCARVC